MSNLRTAAQQALEFIRWSQFVPCQSGDFPEPPSTAPQVEAALKAALAEPQEPDLWGAGYEAGYAAGMAERPAQPVQEPVKEPVALKDAPERIWLRACDDDHCEVPFHEHDEITWRAEQQSPLDVPYVRADLAAPPQRPAEPVQEPYCHVYEYDDVFGLHREFYPRKYNGRKPDRTVPLFTAPQRVPRSADEPAESPGERTVQNELRAAAQQALEALEATHYAMIDAGLLDQDRLNKNFTAHEALKAALAEPVQEPTPMPPFPPVSLWKRGCAVCGIGAGGHAYGYVCSRSDCPTRVTCGGAA